MKEKLREYLVKLAKNWDDYLVNEEHEALITYDAARDYILSLLKEAIKKSLLMEEEIKQIGRTTSDGSMINAVKAVAQAQVNNTLKIVEEG